MTRTVLVTGAAGFVGSAVVRLLTRPSAGPRPGFWDGTKVDHVVGVVRPGGSSHRLAEISPSDHWSIEYADLTDQAKTLDLLRRVRPRAILHVAVDQRIHRDLAEAEQDRLSTAPLQTLVTGLASVGGERFVHTSSAWVLPRGRQLDESTPMQPGTPYGVTKARVDQLLPQLGEQTGIPWINLRLFNIFGRYEPEQRLLPFVVEHLSRGDVAELSSGEHVRDFTNVDDIARAYILALQAGQGVCGSVYHIGSGRATSIREFALSVAECVGDRSLVRFGSTRTRDQDVDYQTADNSRARSILGWTPEQVLENSIDETVQWWLKCWGRTTLKPHRQIQLTASISHE